jgi:hypothetical protein
MPTKKINAGLYLFFLFPAVFYLNAGFAQPTAPPDRFAGSAWENGHLYIHLINTGGAHSNPSVLDYAEVNPLHNIEVTLQLAHAPKAIRLQPENKSLPFTYTNGRANVTVQELAVYSILEIE